MSEDETEQPEPGVAVVGAPSTKAETKADMVTADDIPPPPPPEGRTKTGGARVARTEVRVPRTTKQSLRWVPPGWFVPVLVAVTVVSLLLMSVFAFKWSDLAQHNQTEATIKTVSTDFLLALTNIRPNTIDHDFQVLAGYATGQFATQSNQFFGSSIRQQLEAAQAREDGQVRYLYIQSLTDNDSQATVYAEVDITYSNVHTTAPVADVLQMVMAMVHTSKGWKISNVTTLNPPTSSSTPGSAATGK